MKKVLITAAVIFAIVLAVCITFMVRPAQVKAAGEGTFDAFNLDYVLLQTGDAFVENLGKGPDIGNVKQVVKDKGAIGIALIGWYFPQVADSIADFGYQIDDEEIVYGMMGLSVNDDVINEIAKYGGEWTERASSTRNFSGTIPLLEGEHTIKLYVKFSDGNSKLLYQSRYKNDDTNIALNKPAYITTNGAKNAAGYWRDDFINDGYNPVHAPLVIADPVPLGIYPVVNEGHVTADIYIDLLGIYDLSEVSIHPQGFAQAAYPNTYNVYTSIDGENWDKIGGEAGITGVTDSATPFVYKTTNRARYIRMEVLAGNLLDAGPQEHLTLGEIEAYGTLVEEKEFDYPPYWKITGGYFASYLGGNTNDVTGETVWMGFTSGRLSTSFTFTTDVPFWAIGFPDYWSSANTPVIIELVNEAGEKVWTLSYVKATDGAEGIPFFEDYHELPAGTYTCTVTLNDDTKGEDGAYTHWLVIGHGSRPLGDEYIANENGRAAFWLFVKDDVQGNGFVKREYKQHLNLDALQLDGVDQAKDNNVNITVNKDSKNILFHGWLAANYPIEKIGYKVDGGETVYDESFYGTNDADNAAIMNAAKGIFGVPGNGYRASINVPVTAGGHTVDIVATVAGEEKVFFTFSYAAKGEIVFNAKVNDAGKLVVTATGEFGDKDWIGVYADGNTPGGSVGSLVWWYVGANGGTFEVPFDGMGENDRAALLNDDGTVKVGKYVVYLLANDGYDIVEGTDGIAITVEEQQETQPDTEPETNTQTGDMTVAMFAVIAVLAMGAAVVFLKKKAF